MQNAVAFSDNDVITIAWSYGKKPEGCMGFAIYRINNQGKETTLPSHAVFAGETIKPGQTTAEFPVQKFYWKDPYARLVAEQTKNNQFRYKIVPLTGSPGNLEPMTSLPQILSNQVEISPVISAGISAYFNRGLISTQRVARALQGSASKSKLLPQLKDPNSPLRASLAGNMVEALTGFLARAESGGEIYAALYELNDPVLLPKLMGLGNRLHIILSNSAAKDPQTGVMTDANQPARDALEPAGCEKFNRIMPSGHIGHNKFLVYKDDAGKARAVLFGSTNWTFTGLCAQTNNTVVIEDDDLAARYLDYWQQLANDTTSADGVGKNLQGPNLRGWEKTGGDLKLSGGEAVESWFSPNTPKQRNRNAKSEACPMDMQQVIKKINGVKRAILFLAFYPGTPSIANWIADALLKNKKLFVRGCVTNKNAAGAFYYELKGASPPKAVKGVKTPISEDPRVFAAQAFDGRQIPAGWLKEILQAGFAIVHDKIVVIDPFDDDCAVITGSHNLGYQASYNNDENLAIISGNKKLAAAYATHVLDVYDHFSFRYQYNLTGGQGADPTLKSTPDEWLNKYFDASGHPINAQLGFWMSAVAGS
jgi:phosphatidylserine/phosphatidylglycerophosphate/cardiolipin synthase-like enzyme